MLEIIAAVVGIATGLAGVGKMLVDWRRQRIPREEKNEKLSVLMPIVDKIKKEKTSFDRIRKGEHLKPTYRGAERISLTELPFEIIGERAEMLSERRRYKRITRKLRKKLSVYDKNDLVNYVDHIEPTVDRLIRKIEKEVRQLRR